MFRPNDTIPAPVSGKLTDRNDLIPLFQTKQLPTRTDVIAPDGSLVRNLLVAKGGIIAQFDRKSHIVDEIEHFLSGRGDFWLKQNAVWERYLECQLRGGVQFIERIIHTTYLILIFPVVLLK